MDLKTRKYITNTGKLPSYEIGAENNNQQLNTTLTQRNYPNPSSTPIDSSFSSRWNNGAGQLITGAVPGVIGTIGSAIAGALPTLQTNDLLARAGTSQGSVNGVGYTIQNDVNRGEAMDLVNQQISSNTMQTTLMGSSAGMGIGMGAGMLAGAAGGGWGGPIGMAAGALLGLVGGLIGGHSRRKKERARIRRAEITAMNTNEANRDQAITTALRNTLAENIGDTSNQQLYHASDGAENVNPNTGATYQNHNVNTAYGKVWMPQNAWVEKNEKIVSNDGSVYKVKEGPNDTARAYLADGDSVMTNKLINPETGNTFANDTEAYLSAGLFDHLLDVQRNIKNMKNEGMLKAKYGVEKLPKCKIGWENFAATLPGMITSIADLVNTRKQPIHETNINPYNKYEGRVNELMSGLKIDPYAYMYQINRDEAGQRYAINKSGGLSAGQKMLGNIANSMNSRTARMNALINVQNINNQFKKENAQMLANMGNQLMSENLRAQMFNEQQNAAAHNAWVQGQNMAKRNILDYATQFAKNAWEKNQFDKMYGLYAADVENTRKKTKKTRQINVPNSPAIIQKPYEYIPYDWESMQFIPQFNFTTNDIRR